jgi:hypothetical protein
MLTLSYHERTLFKDSPLATSFQELFLTSKDGINIHRLGCGTIYNNFYMYSDSWNKLDFQLKVPVETFSTGQSDKTRWARIILSPIFNHDKTIIKLEFDDMESFIVRITTNLAFAVQYWPTEGFPDVLQFQVNAVKFSLSRWKRWPEFSHLEIPGEVV